MERFNLNGRTTGFTCIIIGPQNLNAFHVFIIDSLPKLREVNVRLHGRNNTEISLGGRIYFQRNL